LYFIIQSSFFILVGISEVTLTNVYVARTTSCIFSSLTILVIYIWITRATNYKIGAICSILLTFEQYFLRFSRTGVLESTVILFTLAFFYLFWEGCRKKSLKLDLLTGLFLGLAVLTKESSFYLFIFLGTWLLLNNATKSEKGVDMRRILSLIGTAIFMYLGYVVWGFLIDPVRFLKTKARLISRVLDIINNYLNLFQLNKLSTYGTFIEDLLRLMDIYVVTYIILVLAPLCLYLLLREKSRTSLILSSWFISSALSFGILGLQNNKYFVYLSVPSSIVVGFTLSKLSFKIIGSDLKRCKSKLSIFRGLLSSGKKVLSRDKVVPAILIAILISYNGFVWYNLYYVETDDAIRQSVWWIKTNIPQGTKIVARYYYRFFLKDYEIWDITPTWSNKTLNDLKGEDIHYFITSLWWLRQVDDEYTVEYIQSGTVIASFYGRSAPRIDVYYIENPI
jgi:hypothetical protein